MKIGRRIYYDLSTGNVLLNTGERQGGVRPTTVEEDILAYSVLSERNRDSFDVIALAFGQYAQDFAECNGYRINTETKQLDFSYPDLNNPEPTEPVFQKPLSEEVQELKVAQAVTDSTLLELMESILLT